MTLATALRQRALLSRSFGLRKPRVRPTLVKPARFPRGLVIAYLKGIREILDVVTQSIAARVLPQLPRLVAAHAATRIDQTSRRIAIVGAPRAGKTTIARELGAALGLPVHHSDDLIDLGWSEASDALAHQIASAANDNAIFEGVAVVRALRKVLANQTGKPIDQMLVLRTPHVPLNEGQARMAAACETILREIMPVLRARGVEVFTDADALQRTAARLDDDAGGEVTRLFDQVRSDVDKAVPEQRVALLAQQNAIRVAAHSASEVDKQIKQVVNIDVHAPDIGLGDHINAFVAQNVALIKGLTEQTQAQTQAVVFEGLRQGLRYEEIAKSLKAKVGLSETKATMIAGDQVGKLHGECTQLRQTALGIRRYRWATSRDELVRHSHRLLDGTIQMWSKPPIVNPKTGLRAHPGSDTHFFPCRCSAIPMVDDLLQDAGLLPSAAPTTQAPTAPGPKGEPPKPPRRPRIRYPQPLAALPITAPESANTVSIRNLDTGLRDLGPLGSDDAAAIRAPMRDVLARYGMRTSSNQDPRAINVLKVSSAPGGSTKALGVRYADGQMVLRTDIVTGMRHGLAKLVAGKTADLTYREIDAISTLTHEEIHGVGGARANGTYKRAGYLLEEVTTETVSRKVTRELLELGAGDALPSDHPLSLPRPDGNGWRVLAGRAYDHLIAGVLVDLQDAAGLTGARAVATLEETSLAFKQRKEKLDTVGEFVEAFVQCVPGLSTPQRRTLSQLLFARGHAYR